VNSPFSIVGILTIASIGFITPGMGAEPRTEGLGDEIVVTAGKDNRSSLELIGNTAKVPGERVFVVNHQHVYELGTQAAGTWISRGSGQEHLTAIRSPVLTGPGACGAFLMLEDSIPIRPTGFCNVNQLFEIPTELAQSVEVLRGPANALYGSNGLHGTINFLMPAPGTMPGWNISGDIGPDEFYRGKLGWGGSLGKNDMTFGVLADTYDGWRENSGYEQQKGFFRLDRTLKAGGDFGMGFSASNLDQETAGFIKGKDAYKDPALRETNPNPEAFRKADSQRFYIRLTPDWEGALSGSDFRAYLRRSEMDFLMHFLPGQPLEENGQTSGGLIWTVHRNLWTDSSLTAGLDLEYMDGFLKQTQDSPGFGPFPQGKQYDYDVTSVMGSPYAQLEFPVGDAWNVMFGTRLEYLRYDYQNNMVDGNTQDDGITPCPTPSGCRYNRPADRTDDFLNLAPNIGALYSFNQSTVLFTTLSRGFRAPQATELYRLQANQNVADLQSETIDSFELGIRWQTELFRVEGTTFAMEKDHVIFQDANRFNISDGKTRHRGVELQADAQAKMGLYGGVAATYARHTYAFDRPNISDPIQSGDDVDTAPRTLSSVRFGYNVPRWQTELEWIHNGGYFLDAANNHEYDGHNLLNMRAVWRMREAWSLALRLNNLTDKWYADRADFAFGEYRYFPGRGREVFFQVAYQTP
jgi:iron complex outermembrane receptor protein